jgi:hypothetical protein
MEDTHKSLFVYTQPPAMATIFDRLLQVNSEELRAEAELIALAVNLTQNPRCGAQLVEGSKFDRLMKHALELQDDLLFKIMRNVSQVPCQRLSHRHCPGPVGSDTTLQCALNQLAHHLFADVDSNCNLFPCPQRSHFLGCCTKFRCCRIAGFSWPLRCSGLHFRPTTSFGKDFILATCPEYLDILVKAYGLFSMHKSSDCR